MFGKEFANHLDILMQSFGQINDQYFKKAKDKDSKFIKLLKKAYISLFGIPEVGFQVRSRYFKNIVCNYLLHKEINNILDAGSGIGTYTFFLGKKFPKSKIIGGDIDSQKLHASKALAQELNINNVYFSYFDITKVQNKKEYDLIISIDVLEHIDNYQIALKNLYLLLKKNGHIYIHVPQSNQTRIFSSLNMWQHQDHIHEGISKKDLEKALKKLKFKIISSKETFGFFGKLAWELNHLALSKSFMLTGITFPILFILANFDLLFKNKGGLGIAILAKKK